MLALPGGGTDSRDHARGRLVGELGIERQREDLARGPLHDRQVAALAAEDRERRLQVQRDREVDERADPALLERLGERVAPRVAHHVEVRDRAGVGLLTSGSTPVPASSRS